MDYLSGKQSIVGQINKGEKVQKNQNVKESVFSAFCKTVIGCLNPDEQASISEKFFTPEIISVPNAMKISYAMPPDTTCRCSTEQAK